MILKILKNETYPDSSLLPSKGSVGATGYDVKTTSDPEIVGEKYDDGTYKSISYIQYRTDLFLSTSIDTDVSYPGYDVLLFPRSSISKYNLSLANGIGLVDCFSGDSKIKTESGDKTVYELKLNDIVYSSNSNLEIERDFVSAIVSLGEKEILKIETDNGTLEITPGTMVYTETGIKLASELRENDKLLHF